MAHIKFLDGLEINRQVVLREMDSGDFLRGAGLVTNPVGLYTGVLLDLETTGLNHASDVIIEIGLRIFYFDQFYVFKGFGGFYNSFSDPGFPIPAEATKVNGITNDHVKGHKLDWNIINQICDASSIIITHNAKFDCPFMKMHPLFSKREVAWGCSMSQIPWKELGFMNEKLEILSVFHGFYYKGHRALIDADAVGYLLSHKDYLKRLLVEANRELVRVKIKVPYGKNEILKAHSFKWDPNGRNWWKEIGFDEVEKTQQFLSNEIGRLDDCVLEKRTIFNKFY